MKRFRVKVCGITRPKDARLAVELGADMIGMIFYRRSPRFINQKLAGQIVRAIPPVVSWVGVFVDEPIEKMLRLADRLCLDCVQLHGNESAECVSRLQQEGYRVIKAFRIRRQKDYQRVVQSRADLCLLDHATEHQKGGTGVAFDWRIRPKRKIGNLVLAGGISADNVARGVKLFDPVMVDVNSGVESKPGVKSTARLKAFFAECDRIRYGA